MKVSIYDDTGICIGVAWHEDDHGVVEVEPALGEYLATHYTINDGPMRPLLVPVRMAADTFLRLNISGTRMRPVHKFVDGVDETAPKLSWWRRFIGRFQ